MDLFLYGTLLDDDLRHAVTGAILQAPTPARLRRHRRVRVAGTPYPTLRPDPAHSTDGLVLMHVGRSVGERLAAYEGQAYRLRRCLVETSGGTVSAHMYLTDPRRATGEPWSFKTWRNSNKALDMRLLR